MMYLLIILAIVEACTFGYARVEHGQAVSAAADAKAARADKAEYVEQQRAKAAQLVLDWQSARDRADGEQKMKDEANAKLLDTSRQLAAAVKERDALVPADIVSVLRNADGAARAPGFTGVTAPVPKESAPDPGVTEGQRIDWELALKDWAVNCRTHYEGLVALYESLR